MTDLDRDLKRGRRFAMAILRRWFRDAVLRRVLTHAGWLLAGSGIASVLTFVAGALAARSLGLDGFGVLALVLAYVGVIGTLVSFQSWQAIVKYGSEARQAGRIEELRRLLRFGYGLDMGTSLAGGALAMGLSRPLVSLLGWDPAVAPMAMLYAGLIFFSFNGTSQGVLRLFGRFDLLGYAAVSGAAARCAGVAVCAVRAAPLYEFVLAYLAGGIVEQMVLFVGALRVAERHAANPLRGGTGLRAALAFPGIWHYVWTSNINLSLRMLSREMDLLVIGSIAGTSGVGLFKIAKMLTQVFSRLLDPFYQAIFPELSTLHAAGRRAAFLRLLRRSSLLAGVLAVSAWTVFALLGGFAIRMIYGPAFSGAYPVTLIYLVALVLAAAGFALQPAMLALGRPRRSFVAHICATAFYFMTLFPLVHALDVQGAAWAYAAYYLVWTLIMISRLRPLLERRAFTGVPEA